MPKYIDAHAHVNFAAYDGDRDSVITRALEADTWLINVGTQKDTSELAVNLAHKYSEGVYAIVGLHPVHTAKSYHDIEELGDGGAAFTSRGETFDKEYYRLLAEDPKVVGIGECGLDYYRLTVDTVEHQRDAFVSQIELANKVSKPLMLHIRPGQGTVPSAYDDAIALLKAHARVAGNAHFFAGTWDHARSLLDLGFTISCTGVITFTTDYDEIIKRVPLDRLLAETDCPYVTPVPYRGRRNEPLHVDKVVEKIALLKQMPLEVVSEALVQNTCRLFALEPSRLRVV